MKSGFTLIEMLVVIGIIAVLLGASMSGYGVFVRRAANARCAELVHNVQVAMVGVMQADGAWPRPILHGSGAPNDAEMGKEPGAALAKRGAMSLVYKRTEREGDTVYELAGNDRFGVVTPWAKEVLKRNASASESTHVPTGGTIRDHVLHYAIDDDGDGRVRASVGGASVIIRGSAAVWCCGANGKIEPYGQRGDDVYSWSADQVEN